MAIRPACTSPVPPRVTMCPKIVQPLWRERNGGGKKPPDRRKGPGRAGESPSLSKEGLEDYRLTWLVAEPTMMSPVFAPVRASTRTTWIMFTVTPLEVMPSPVRCCSFKTT